MLDDFANLVRQATTAEFWFCACVAGGAALAAAWGAFNFLQRKRVIEDIPTALIRSASQGYLELQGRAGLMDGDDIIAPLSQRICVWYRYKVERREQRHSGRDRSSHWRTIEHGTSDDLFELFDGSGRCAIDPEGAAVTPAHKHTWYGSTRIPGRYHESDGVWWARALGRMGQPYRYTERRIEPGDELYVIGDFITHGGAATRFDRDGAVGDLLREWKRDQAYMLQHFDRDGDGNIDIEEWAGARQQAAQQVAASSAERAAPPPVDVLGQTRDRRRPFVIHAGTEAQIVAHYTRCAGALLALGIPALVIVLWSIGLRNL